MSIPASVNEGGRTQGLTLVDAVAVLVGVVIGIGIFGFPPLVAQHASTPMMYLGLWLAGGVVMLLGALCYAELGATYPDSGGEYHFLRLAWGRRVGLLFAWARGSVIQTGAIAAVAFIYGEYANALFHWGAHGVALHAAVAIVALTLLNMRGNLESYWVQRVLTGVTVLALLAVSVGGLVLSSGPITVPDTAATLPTGSLAGALGMGMVFVLLTYGGWNEAAYLSGELREPSRNMHRVLVLGTVIVTALYLIINVAYLRVFGLEGLAQSNAVGAQLMGLVAGDKAAVFLGLLVCCAALGTINASIYTGARVYTALARDVPALRTFGLETQSSTAPRRALLVQGVITLGLLIFGALSRNGVELMVAYTAPVFWLFMGLTALAVIRLRRRHPSAPRAFSVPLFPLTPILFAFSCLGLFWASAQYAGWGAWLGLLVLMAGLPLLRLDARYRTAAETGRQIASEGE